MPSAGILRWRRYCEDGRGTPLRLGGFRAKTGASLTKMHMKNEQDEGSVEAVVAGALTSPGLDDLAADYAQLGLDGILGDTLSAIPVVKSVAALVRIGLGFHHRLFARKLFDFLTGFRGVSDWERRDMVSRLGAGPGYGRHVGEHLSAILERID